MNRRNILRLLGAAPVAGPSVAKEAARRMGLYTAAFFAGVPQTAEQAGVTGSAAPMAGAAIPDGPAGYLSYLRAELAEFYDEDQKQARADTARYYARALDTDLASLRSVSPAWAYQTQYARTMKRVDDERYATIQRRITKEVKKATGVG